MSLLGNPILSETLAGDTISPMSRDVGVERFEDSSTKILQSRDLCSVYDSMPRFTIRKWRLGLDFWKRRRLRTAGLTRLARAGRKLVAIAVTPNNDYEVQLARVQLQPLFCSETREKLNITEGLTLAHRRSPCIKTVVSQCEKICLFSPWQCSYLAICVRPK